jgi:hypothetical protein
MYLEAATNAAPMQPLDYWSRNIYLDGPMFYPRDRVGRCDWRDKYVSMALYDQVG